jgi:hypothetical protein
LANLTLGLFQGWPVIFGKQETENLADSFGLAHDPLTIAKLMHATSPVYRASSLVGNSHRCFFVFVNVVPGKFGGRAAGSRLLANGSVLFLDLRSPV